MVGYRPRGCKESGTTELLTLAEACLQGHISYHHHNLWYLAQGKPRALYCELKRSLVLAWTLVYSLPGLLIPLGLRIQDQYSVTQPSCLLNDSSWRQLGQAATRQLLGDAKKDMFQDLTALPAFLIFTNLEFKSDLGLFLTWFLGTTALFKKNYLF